MKIPFLNFSCEECQAKGKKVAAISLVAGLVIGAGAIYFLNSKNG